MVYRIEVVFSCHDDDLPELHVLQDFHLSHDDDFTFSYALFLDNLIQTSWKYLFDDFGVSYFVKEIKCSLKESED